MSRNDFMLNQHVIQMNYRSDYDNQEKLRILVATDNHVGFREEDPIRGEDSFNAFEEVLSIAKEEKVDLLLLGGDLFHEMNPSQKCLYKMINLLNKYVLGDGEIKFQIPNLTDLNFQNSNLNIELPIFIIHGSHDYPSNELGNLSILDLLHATKHLNHFGKFSGSERIRVSPIIIQKGDTVVALYGIGYMKDKQFFDFLNKNLIDFVKPTSLGYEKTVCILIIHQSRYKSGQSYQKCVHPKQFPDWIDLIIRGHEHDQLDELEIKESTKRVIQPGSTIATSLIPEEATPRRVILFEINGQDANFQDIILIQSYRPILYETIELKSILNEVGFDFRSNFPKEGDIENTIWEYIQNSMKHFKDILSEQYPSCPELLKKQLQLRFKIEHTGIESVNSSKLESKLQGDVANPGEIFQFWKKSNPNNVQKIKKNPKLNSNFIKTLKDKEDFDTIGNDTAKDICLLYEMRIQHNQKIFCLPISEIMKTVEGVNHGNHRPSQIQDIIKDLQRNLDHHMVAKEQVEISKIKQTFESSIKSTFDLIDKRINNPQSISHLPTNRQQILYRHSMDSHFQDLKSSLGLKIRTKVAQLYLNGAQDFPNEFLIQESNYQSEEKQQIQGNKVENEKRKTLPFSDSELVQFGDLSQKKVKKEILNEQMQPISARITQEQSNSSSNSSSSLDGTTSLKNKRIIKKREQPSNIDFQQQQINQQQPPRIRKLTYSELLKKESHTIYEEAEEENKQQNNSSQQDDEKKDYGSDDSDCEFTMENRGGNQSKIGGQGMNPMIPLFQMAPPPLHTSQFAARNSLQYSNAQNKPLGTTTNSLGLHNQSWNQVGSTSSVSQLNQSSLAGRLQQLNQSSQSRMNPLMTIKRPDNSSFNNNSNSSTNSEQKSELFKRKSFILGGNSKKQ